MKFLLDEGDKRFLEDYDNIVSDKKILEWVNGEQESAFTFEVLDKAKANNFFLSIYQPTQKTQSEESKQFEEATGIHITSLVFDANSISKDLLRSRLQNMKSEIDELLESL